MKKARMKKIIKFFVSILDFLLLLLFGKIVIKKKKIQYAHFSIDDVTDVYPKNILDRLLILHNRYGLVVHNYLMYTDEVKNPSIKPRSINGWLDCAPHQSEYIQEIFDFIKKNNLKVSKAARLHEYKIHSKNDINLLLNEGVEILLTAESSKRKSYLLTDKQINALDDYGKLYLTNGGGYVKTDFRLEKFIFFRLLSRKYKGGTLFFLHMHGYIIK